MIGYLMENQHIYGEIEARGDRLRNGFNEWAQSNGYPAMMTGISSLFQIYLKDTPVIKLRDTVGLYDDAMRDLQLFARYNGVLIPWLHLFLISAAHTDEIVDEMLVSFKESVESALSINGVI
jgi:glutamate-1-semialdehyde 2,1-aminomutase